MKQFLRGSRKHIAAGVIFHVLTRATGVLSAYLLGLALDGAVTQDVKMLLMLTLYALVSNAVSFIFDILASRFTTMASGDIGYKLSVGLLRDLYARASNIFRRKNDAFYINMLTNDMETVWVYRYNVLPMLIGYAAEALVALGVLAYISPWMFLVSLVLAFLPMGTARLFTKRVQRVGVERSTAAEHYTAAVTEAIQGYDTIKPSNPSKGYMERFMTKTRNMYDAIFRDKHTRDIAYRTARALTMVSALGGTLAGGYLVVLGQMTVGGLLAALNIFSFVADGIGNFIELYTSRHGAKPIQDKILNELTAPAVPTPEAQSISLRENDTKSSKDAYSIEYKQVTFGFGETPLYQNFSYSFESGRAYAIIGESGCGKSTLLKLLCKYYENYSGVITIGGRDVRSLSEVELFSIIGIVNQTAFLLNDSLENNITMYQKETPAYQPLLHSLSLDPLAKRVGDTPLGDFGDNISGGERQRVSVARTLLQQPKIIIFDEPTTGLDPENTQLINDYIFSLNGITRIVISHDQSADFLRRFDAVIQLTEKITA